MVRLTIKSRKVPIGMFTVPAGVISGIYPRRDSRSATPRSIRPAPRTRNTITAPIASPDNSNSDSASSVDTVITPDIALPDNTNSGKGSKAQSQSRITPITLSSDFDSDSQSESESEPLLGDRKEPTPSAQFRSSANETAPAPPLEDSTEQREAGIAVQSVGEKRKRISEECSEPHERNDVQIQLARMEKRQIQMSSDIAQMKNTLNSIVSLLLDQQPSVKTNP